MNVQAERRLLLAYPDCEPDFDAPDVVAYLAQLEPFTFRIEHVTTTAALFTALIQPPPHCILVSDRITDDLDGLIRDLRTLAYPIYPQAVVIIGESVDPQYALRLIRAGASDYLPRADLTPLRLICAIENAVRQRETEIGLADEQRRNRQIEEIAAQSHEHYGEGLHSIRAMRFDYNVLTGRVERSRGLYAVTGYTVEESEPTRDWWNALIHPDDRPRMLAEYQAHLQDANPQHDLHAAEYRLIHRNGQIIYVWSQSTLLRDESGKVVQIVGSVTDISERKRAEQELKLTQERFRLARDAVQAIVYDYDLVSGTVERSHGLTEMLGYDTDEIDPSGGWWITLVHPDDVAFIRTDTARVFNDPAIYQYDREYRVRHKDGHWVYVWDRAVYLRDEKGVPVRVVGSTIDISALKETQSVLRERDQLIRQTADTLPGILFLYDLIEKRIIFTNQQVEQMFGISPDGFLAMDRSFLQGFIHPADIASVLELLGQAHALPDGEFLYVECRLRHASGEWCWMQVRMVMFARLPNGEPKVVLGYLQDINTQKQIALAEQDQRQFAEAIARIALTLNSTLDLPQVLEHILDTLSQVVPYDTVNIMLVRDRQARVVGMRGFEENSLVELGEALRVLALPIDQHPDLNTMMHVHEPIIIPLIAEHPTRSPSIASTPLQSYLGMVIAFGDEVLGFINLNSRLPDFFTVEHAARLKVFAAQAALAIRNAIALEHAQELSTLRERQRIARDLHDSVSQLLFSAALLSETLMRVPDHPQLESNLEQLWRLNRGALAEMRKLVVEMRDVDTESFNLVEMMTQLANAAMGHADQLEIKLHVEGSVELPVKVRTTFYRITQEALNNVIKHAHAHHVAIQLDCEKDGAVLTVTDDGQGFDPALIGWSSVGLVNIRERSRAIDARSDVTSVIGMGTTVRVEWNRPAPAKKTRVKARENK